ncbi:MAG: SRPBCC family protein [Acidimicrobiales bacterium]
MRTFEHAIDIDLPRATVYGRWTPSQFPTFMHNVESVEEDGDGRLHWVASLWGARREWDARITERVPGKVLAWESVDGAENAGRVVFADLEDGPGTRVTLTLNYEGRGLVDDLLGEKVGLAGSIAERALTEFKRLVEAEVTDPAATVS